MKEMIAAAAMAWVSPITYIGVNLGLADDSESSCADIALRTLPVRSAILAGCAGWVRHENSGPPRRC